MKHGHDKHKTPGQVAYETYLLASGASEPLSHEPWENRHFAIQQTWEAVAAAVIVDHMAQAAAGIGPPPDGNPPGGPSGGK